MSKKDTRLDHLDHLIAMLDGMTDSQIIYLDTLACELFGDTTKPENVSNVK